MLDVLALIVVLGPTIFAIAIEAIDEQIRKHRYWKFGVIVFGLTLSGLTALQLKTQRRTSARERESAIKETSDQVTAAVTEKFKQTVTDQTNQIADLKKQ